MTYAYDTIAAIATPIGEGGIGVIRISGPIAVEVSGEIFRTKSGVAVADLRSHTVHYGWVVDPVMSHRIDDGLLTVFRAPGSYTGEDSVEISCHGGIVPMRRVLEVATRAGARLAEPGEFTKRAFLNGRLDLAQAEAVLDIIRARTDAALRVARRQFEGVLSMRIRTIRDELVGTMAHIEASIDFPEDVEEWKPGRIAGSIRDGISSLESLLATADRGKIYREGLRTVIVGHPNVGKSSLLNALLRESRAIVTPIPGTTRDVIEETLNIRGIPICTVDTAGLRETDDPIERIGVERTLRASRDADLVLAVLDAENGFDAADAELLSSLSEKQLIVVLNKSDLIREADAGSLAAEIQAWLIANGKGNTRIVTTAAPSNEGILELEELIADTVLSGAASANDSAVVSNVRHRRALEEAKSCLEQAMQTAASGMPLDFISIDLKSALDALGTVTGETVSEDIIERIFSEFCIGK
jgi:tRNA modification GTPase